MLDAVILIRTLGVVVAGAGDLTGGEEKPEIGSNKRRVTPGEGATRSGLCENINHRPPGVI
jgi:hypothetical protein